MPTKTPPQTPPAPVTWASRIASYSSRMFILSLLSMGSGFYLVLIGRDIGAYVGLIGVVLAAFAGKDTLMANIYAKNGHNKPQDQ